MSHARRLRRPPAVPQDGQRVVLLDLDFQTTATVPQKQIDNAYCITDLTGSQTEACGEIVIYSKLIGKETLYNLGKYSVLVR